MPRSGCSKAPAKSPAKPFWSIAACIWGHHVERVRRRRRGKINGNPIMKRLAAEFFGTFSLVFAGTGAIIINDVAGGAVSHVGIGLTFGLVGLAMIYALGDVSGAHLNPPVTLAFFAPQPLAR